VKIFKNSNLSFLRALCRAPGGQKSGKIEFTLTNPVPVRLDPVAMLLDIPAVEPSLPCPDPSRETWGRGGRTHPDPPLCPAAPCTTPTVMALPPPTHSTPSPRQHPASTPPRPPRPALLAHAARHRPSMPLETLAPALSRAYKNRPSTPRRSTPSPLPIPTLLSSSLPRSHPISVSVRRRVPGDSGHRWSFCWCKVEEQSSRRRSATSPSSPASSPSSPRRRTLVAARR
jgi:hypothetical protein